MRLDKQSRVRPLLALSIPLWIPPVLFSVYYPLFTYVLVPYFGGPPAASAIPGVSANDMTYIFFSVVFVVCLLAQVLLKERLPGFWRKALYFLLLCTADAALCWVFLHMLLL